ncbi:MAG TPA: DEAD/DEAH box helicase [Cyclobacteriaceae bacterium]|nr:DEAD/DEAH box helicase [Cyclobacteriaceae bacterium]HMV07858.1 DEAD/DEAH box helicase [Cyclobacteriaceae bacterium]HMV88126.1 DEAD/DEAH box helicase [Cyclobacteriaceae bacterium]HMW98992.1 DEAD/DEAH box helicase [Cyclobacteriaceae bacterium]HMX48374.1 DEAD/DEAH box helicase [Cyclobacteriaceae bacterium]
MKVSASQPFQIIYSLFQHEYLGLLIESYIVHLDEKGKLTFQHQNISSKNAREFSKGLDDRDYELIKLTDAMEQESVVKKFVGKPMKSDEFFSKVYSKTKGNEALQEQIEIHIENKRAEALELMKGKMLFEMGSDGEPTWKKIEVMPSKASIQFHFMRSNDATNYYPTITYQGKKLDLPSESAYLVCKGPAWMVLNGKLYGFEKYVDGKKLLPFLSKKFVVIPKNLEETYYNRFVAPLIASFDDVEAKGFEINKNDYDPKPILTLSELVSIHSSQAADLFDSTPTEDKSDESGKIVFDLSFKYGKHRFQGRNRVPVSVTVERHDKDYVFHRVTRKSDTEKNFLHTLQKLGLPMKDFNVAVPKSEAFSWLNENRVNLLNLGFEVSQPQSNDKKYFVGKAVIEVEVKENIDWFDIHARIKFGEFEIPFKELRKLILKKKVEFKLPNGEIAIIPEAWLTRYADLFALSETHGDKERPVLKKHHLNLVKELEEGNLAKVHLSERLRTLNSFSGIKSYPVPAGFKGELRPYQRAGYNWLRFLNEYKLGGCLADDMGLGKTVQTLTMLLAEKEANAGPSLLIMPTSLIYNWEMEASKFTPELKVLNYTGTLRNKDVKRFEKYDVVLTSYGITRLDSELLQKFYFNYIILDESQVIKNPSSNIAKAVRELKSRHKLVLTGTPLENTTMDLWSQMSFINPGILGTQSYFRQEFQLPIEKKNDEAKSKKLHAIIKPFVLRRHKSQVATELPEKVEYVQYSEMTPEQERKYEETKSYYRGKILDLIDKEGMGNSRFMILEGLTKLRQLANHPKMIEPSYAGDSGKLEDITHMLENAMAEDHKVLVFSQFVKHLNLVQQYLKANKINYAYLDGGSTDRKEQVEKFNKDPKTKAFLISIKAGGLGLNLTEADYVFILDPWWNPAVEAQAVDRAHRIGQKRKVFTYKFITRNSVEEKILQLQQKKLKLTNELIVTEESIMKQLTREDISQMLA